EDRLVGDAVFRTVGRPGLPADVRRQRYVPDPLEERIVHLAIEEDFAPAVVLDRLDAGGDPLREANLPSGLRAAAGLRESRPPAGVSRCVLQQEDLDDPILLVTSPQAGGTDSDVVAHENVAFPEKLGRVGKAPMPDASIGSIQHQEPARPAGTCRLRAPLRPPEELAP